MASVSSVNRGVADLLQTLSSTGSTPVTSTLSSSKVQSALQNASPVDLVHLSDEALQLQEAGGLFGNSAPAQNSTTPASLLQQALNSFLSGSTSTSLASSASSSASSSTPASEEAAAQSEQLSALFGTPSISLLG